MKRIGDLVWLPHRNGIRTVVAIEPCYHQGHRFYGFRLARARYGRKVNIGGLRHPHAYSEDGMRMLYWVRSDRLRPCGSTLIKTGRVGRPKRQHGGRRPGAGKNGNQQIRQYQIKPFSALGGHLWPQKSGVRKKMLPRPKRGL